MNPVHFTIIESVCGHCRISYSSQDGRGVSGTSHGYCTRHKEEVREYLQRFKQRQRRR